jgi:transcriptional regulator with XRE-family HTH domain
VTFGEYIAAARKAKGLSQRELAQRVHKEDGTPISLQYLNDIERGRRNPPPLYLIEQLARILDLSVEYLVMLANQPLAQLLLEEGLSPDQLRPEEVQAGFKAFRRAIADARHRDGNAGRGGRA